MELTNTQGIDILYIRNGQAIFREHAGSRELVALAPISAPSGWAESQTKAESKPGSYYLADHGSYSINNPITAKAMVELFNA